MDKSNLIRGMAFRMYHDMAYGISNPTSERAVKRWLKIARRWACRNGDKRLYAELSNFLAA